MNVIQNESIFLWSTLISNKVFFGGKLYRKFHQVRLATVNRQKTSNWQMALYLCIYFHRYWKKSFFNNNHIHRQLVHRHSLHQQLHHYYPNQAEIEMIFNFMKNCSFIRRTLVCTYIILFSPNLITWWRWRQSISRNPSSTIL